MRKLFEARQMADYKEFVQVSAEEAVRYVEDAKAFLAMITKHTEASNK